MKHRAIFAAFMFAMICFTTAAFAQGNGTPVTKFTFENPSYYNPCCDELISLGGTVHFTVHETTNADGSVTISVHQNVSGVKGTGLSSGISYNASENVKQTQTFDPNAACPFSFDQTFTTRLVGKGKGGRQCSFNVKFTYHFAVDADCNVTVDDVSVEFDCANGNVIN